MTSPPAPRPVRSTWRRVLAGSVAVLALLVGSLLWLIATESGLRALAGAARGLSGGALRLEAVSGRLADSLAIGRLEIDQAALRLSVESLTLRWRPAALWRGELAIDVLSASRVSIATAPAEDATPPSAPASLALPGTVQLGALSIAELDVLPWEAGAPPRFTVRELFVEAASDGQVHRVARARAVLPFGAATASGQISATAPFALAAEGALAGVHEGREFELHLRAGGDLQAPTLAARASGAGVTGVANVVAAPFEPLPLRRLEMEAGELDPAAFVAGAPTAALRIAAKLAPEADDGPLGWRLSGPFSVTNARPASVDRNGLPLSAVAGHVRWAPDAVVLSGLSLQVPGGGRLEGDARWVAATDSAVGGFGRVDARLRLSGIDPRRLDARLPPARLQGRLDAEGDAARQQLRAELSAGAARIALDAVLRDATGESPRLSGRGMLRAFDPAAFVARAPAASLNVDFDADASLGASPRTALALRILPSRLRGLALQGHGRAVVEAARASGVAIDLDLAGNRLQGAGAWGRAGDVMQVGLDAPALAALGQALALPLGGRARLDARIAGTPAQPAGELTVFAEALRLPGDLAVAGFNAQARLEGGADGRVEAVAGLTGMGPVDERSPRWIRTATVALQGSRAQHAFDVSAAVLEGERLELRAEGALGDAAANGARGAWPSWRGRIAKLVADGRWPARLSEPVALEAGIDRVALGRANIDAGERGRIRLDETEWTPQRTRLRGSLTGLAFGLLAPEQQAPDRRLRRGPGPLQLGAEWDFTLGATAQGAARLFREAGDLTVQGEIPARLGLRHFEAHLAAQDNRLALSWAAAGSELGELAGAVTAQAERSAEGGWRLAPDAALLGSARLTMPSIAWVGRLMQEHVITGGSLEARVELAGTPAAPQTSGRIAGEALSVALVDQGLHLSGGELRADFDASRLRLERLRFVSPNRVRPNDSRVPFARLTREPGRLDATGEIALESGAGRFAFEAERLPILQRGDRWLILSGSGTASSTWTSVALAAQLRADAGYVELADTPPPSLSDDVVILGREAPASTRRLAVSADIGIGLGEHFYLSALGVDTRLTGALQLRLREGLPLSAVGSIATAGGTYKGYGQQLAIERGLINFQGPPDNPGLNVVALRKGLAVEAGIEIAGSARRPRIRLVSQPNVPDPDKLAWIALGRAPSAGAGGDMGLLLPAAQALLGGPGGGMTEQLSRSLGFDEFAIGQGELYGATRSATSRVVGDGTAVSGGDTVGGQVLTLGKRLSSKLFLSVEQSLGGAASLVRLTYQLTERVSVVARGGTNNSADIYYTISFE